TSVLVALTYKRKGPRINKMRDCRIFGQFVPRTALRLNPAKICPHCLREFGYVCRIWDLKIVTTCPLHKCLLLDECPNCRRTLPFLRSRLNICKCQYDWRDYSAQSVDDTEI